MSREIILRNKNYKGCCQINGFLHPEIFLPASLPVFKLKLTTLKKYINYLITVFSMKCPRCRQGKIFTGGLSVGVKKNLAMNKQCPVCSQPTEIEVGFYYGTGYVSYALAVALTATTFVAWLVLIGFSLDDNRIIIWFISNSVLLVLLQPWLMRFSRSLWLSWFVKYDPHWKTSKITGTERVIEAQMEGKQDIARKTLD